MGTEQCFRSLISNQFLTDYDYATATFSFKTIFYRTAFSYFCCECGFQNEFVTYISENGEINQEVCGKILQAIKDGKCHHVEFAEDKHVVETSVHGLHIAAAANTVEAIRKFMRKRERNALFLTSIFKLTPYQLAIQKGHMAIVKFLNEDNPETTIYKPSNYPVAIITSKKVSSGLCISIQSCSSMELALRERNKSHFEAVSFRPCDFRILKNSFILAFRGNLDDMQKLLVDNFKKFKVFELADVQGIVIAAIVYDKPDIFSEILKTLFESKTRRFLKMLPFLASVCTVLSRNMCMNTLLKYYKPVLEIGSFNRLDALLYLLYEFSEDFRSEILGKLRTVPCLKELINKPHLGSLTRLQTHVTRDANIDPRFVKDLLDLGADVNAAGKQKDESILTRILSKQNIEYNIAETRETLEVILYENPLIDINKKVVSLALRLDATLNKRTCSTIKGNYLADSKEHPFCELIDDSFNPLHYFAPLFIESGFPYTRQKAEDALDKPLAHAEVGYLRFCMQSPRTLKLSCRDVLRKTFMGRKLHLFVESLNIPTSIKDFVLLKDILFYLPR